MTDDVLILGATGRVGRAVTTVLQQSGVPLVLAGRDRQRLETAAADAGGSPRLAVGTLTENLADVERMRPAVVVNTVGPFTNTAERVVRACPPGTHYVDVANELSSFEAILGLDRHLADRDSVVVTGAGFGVLATESILLRLCTDHPGATRVRVDALASVATEEGALGAALAASIVESLPSGGREVRGGRLTRTALAGARTRLVTPDGDGLTTASLPSGELIAAWRASGAVDVVAASNMAPSGTLARLAFPVAAAIMRVPRLRRFAIDRLAAIHFGARERPRGHSWARAWAQWPSGEVREAWLRAGDAQDFTVAVLAEVTRRLLNGDGRPGAHTPGGLFGPDLAIAAGADFVGLPA